MDSTTTTNNSTDTSVDWANIALLESMDVSEINNTSESDVYQTESMQVDSSSRLADEYLE